MGLAYRTPTDRPPTSTSFLGRFGRAGGRPFRSTRDLESGSPVEAWRTRSKYNNEKRWRTRRFANDEAFWGALYLMLDEWSGAQLDAWRVPATAESSRAAAEFYQSC